MFTFRSMINFELIFVKYVRFVFRLILFIYLFIHSSVSVTFLRVHVLQRMLAAPQLQA